jgi:predicted HicB family RNase H-like nuclease
MVNVAIRFPIELHERSKKRAAAEDLSLSQLIRKLLRDYLEIDN